MGKFCTLRLQMDWEEPTEGSDLISDDDPTPPNSDDGDSEMVLGPGTTPLVSTILISTVTLPLISFPTQTLTRTLTQRQSHDSMCATYDAPAMQAELA